MRVKINYLIILTIDIHKGADITLSSVKPKIARKFDVTETKVEETEWCKLHRKYVGVLNPKEAKEFIEEYFSSTCRTCGSLIRHQLYPAVSFNYNDAWSYGYDINAYVSPIIETNDESLLIKEIDSHPNSEIVSRKVGDKLDQCLDLLLNYFEFPWIASSIFVNTKQLYLNL